MSLYQPDRLVIVELEGSKERVEELLDQIASANPEHWRKVYKRRNSSNYCARACFTVDFQGDVTDDDPSRGH